MSAYTTFADAVKSVLPDDWQLLEYETPVGAGQVDATTVELKVREVNRLPAAPIGKYQVDWVITVTTEYPDREVADPALFDDLFDFLTALDSLGKWMGWTTATKALNEDGRLAYDITVRMHTKPDPDQPVEDEGEG